MIRYDIGGSECPYDDTIAIVDLNPIDPDWIHEKTQNDWIQRDINIPGWTEGLEPAEFINIGALLRYVGCNYNDPEGGPEEGSPEKIRELAPEIAEIAQPEATIQIRDYLRYIHPFIDALPASRVKRIDIQLNSWDADDTGSMEDADWIATIYLS